MNGYKSKSSKVKRLRFYWRAYKRMVRPVFLLWIGSVVLFGFHFIGLALGVEFSRSTGINLLWAVDITSLLLAVVTLHFCLLSPLSRKIAFVLLVISSIFLSNMILFIGGSFALLTSHYMWVTRYYPSHRIFETSN